MMFETLHINKPLGNTINSWERVGGFFGGQGIPGGIGNRA